MFSSCSCCDRNSWMRVSLSRLFNFSSVYFRAMSLPPGICMALLYQKSADYANRVLSGIRHNAHAPDCRYGLWRRAFVWRLQMDPICVPAASSVPWPYLQGCMLPECASFLDGLAGRKFLCSAQKSSHIFRRFHRPDGLLRGDRQPLHQPSELLRRQGAHFGRGARPLEPAS